MRQQSSLTMFLRPVNKPLSLIELDDCIKCYKHLPEIPSSLEVERDGIALGEMNKMLLKKIEEMTLYLIEKDKEILELSN